MKSFEAVCRDNYGRIYKYIFAMTGSREASEDLVQDVFTVAWEKGSAFLRHENPTAFLYKTARNLTLTYLKRLSQYPSQPLDDIDLPDGGDLLETVLREWDRLVDERALVSPVLGRLTEKQRALYTQRYIDRQPTGDIAARQGVAEAALRMRLVRLRKEIIRIVSQLQLDEV